MKIFRLKGKLETIAEKKIFDCVKFLGRWERVASQSQLGDFEFYREEDHLLSCQKREWRWVKREGMFGDLEMEEMLPDGTSFPSERLGSMNY